MAEEFKIIIHKDGSMHVETSGFTGGKCLTETKKLEQALRDIGIAPTETKEEKKTEMYASGGKMQSETLNHY
jgi:hypothetical protein